MTAMTYAGPKSCLFLSGSCTLTAPSRRVADLPGPAGHWLTGNQADDQHGRRHQLIENWAREHGPIFRFRFAGRRIVCVSDAALINDMLGHQSAGLGRSRYLNESIDDVVPGDLFGTGDEAWQRQSRLLDRALTRERLDSLLPTMHRITRRLMQRWLLGARLRPRGELMRDLRLHALEMVAAVLLGDDSAHAPRAAVLPELQEWMALIERRVESSPSAWGWFGHRKDRQAQALLERVRERVLLRIADGRRMQARQGRALATEQEMASGWAAPDIVSALIDACGTEFSDEDVAGCALSLMFAGVETSAQSIGWLLAHLSTHSKVAERARDEVDRTLGTQAIAHRRDQFGQLRYLRAVALESMRLKPIAPLLITSAETDISLAGLRLPRGQEIVLALRVASQRSGVFEQPWVFDPERWMSREAVYSEMPRRCMPAFGNASRDCPIRSLAMTHTLMVASMLLRNFEHRLPGGVQAIQEHMALTVGPKSLEIELSPRRIPDYRLGPRPELPSRRCAMAV